MAIQQLDAHGYRSFREISWKPGKLNLLVGPNGSGKSNLLRLLELIAQTARGQLASTLKPGGIEPGGIVPLLWDYQVPALDWTIRLDPVDAGRDPIQDALTVECRLEHLPNTSSYQIAVDTLGNWHKYSRKMERSPLWVYTRDARRAMVYDQQAHGLVQFPDPDPNESLLPQMSDPRTNPIPTHTRRFLDGWRIYHDVHVEKGSPMRAAATTQFAKLAAADGSNLVSVLHTLYTGSREFKKQINDGMRAGFGEQFEELVFQPAAAQQIQLAIQWRSSHAPHAAQDLSDGTLRFLFLLTVLASPEPATLIAIDEPEIGLHPSMLPILAEFAAEAASKTQVMITSHSPVLLDAFSRADAQVTVFHWEDGESTLFPLSSEAMEKWLADYRLGQLFTSGDLEAIASPAADVIPDLGERTKGIPPEDAAMPTDAEEAATHG